jgi:pyrroline-5-carboxylate reductase
MTVGFIGVGHIVTAVVTGLCSLNQSPGNILLSPRNAGNSAALSGRFAEVCVASSNQEVVDGSDLTVLALRPQVAPEVLASLRFRVDKPVVSLMAMMPFALLRELLAPASTIVRAVLLPSAAHRQGPIAMWPGNLAVEALFSPIGGIMVTDTETALHTVWATTALAAPYYQLLDRIVFWLTTRGLTRETATAYVGPLFLALGSALDPPPNDFSRLAHSVSTRGGLNEQAARELQSMNWYAALEPILETAFERLEGTPVPEPGFATGDN